MGKDKFLKGALILTVAGLLVKVIGSVNRILLSRLLGGEGGLFSRRAGGCLHHCGGKGGKK